jgi:hypothetical protein
MSWYRPPIYSVYRYPNSSNPRIAEIMSWRVWCEIKHFSLFLI